MSAALQFAAPPISIPLSEQDPQRRKENEERLLYFVGLTIDQVKSLAAVPRNGRKLRLRRFGSGQGTRYVLYLADWVAYMEGLPSD